MNRTILISTDSKDRLLIAVIRPKGTNTYHPGKASAERIDMLAYFNRSKFHACIHKHGIDLYADMPTVRSQEKG